MCFLVAITIYYQAWHLLFYYRLTWRVPLMEKKLLILLEHLSSPLVFSGVRVTRSLVLCVCFCRSLFVLLYFFFWSLCCLFFFDLRILITPLVSSNSSYLAIVMPESQNIIYNFANYYFYHGYQLTTMYY